MTAAVQAARFAYPKLPKLRSQLKLPALRFYFSPARVRRIMRVVRSALPGNPHPPPFSSWPGLQDTEVATGFALRGPTRPSSNPQTLILV